MVVSPLALVLWAACTAFIVNADYAWFSHFLHRAEPSDEGDFWQPSPHGFRAIPPGAPFFFRLGAPHKAIAGFGFFARYERAPAWLAWEFFGDKNGTDTLAEMAARIETIRRRTGSPLFLGRPQDYEIGCIMISQPVFFPRDERVADHADWHPRIRGGKTVDVASGDGRRVLAECQERAAHLRPGAEGGAHVLPNGLLLRADIRRLYDAGYVTVTPDYRFRVSGDLIDDFHNGREYERYAGRVITVPPAPGERPDRGLLDRHAQAVFRG